MRVAVDCTPLLTPHTGIGVFCDHLVRGLAARHDLDLVAFALTFRGRGRLAAQLPDGVTVVDRPTPAALLKELWRRGDRPSVRFLTAGADVVHGPNFVVPPSAGAAEVVSVHDLGPLHFPHLVSADARRVPDLLRRAIGRGAWVHTDSAFVAAEVVRYLDADPARVRAIHPGVAVASEGPGTTPGDGAALAGGGRYLLALGSVEPRKNVPELVHAFDRLASTHADLRLVIAGPHGLASADAAEAIGAAAHGDRVVRLQWVDDRQRSALLRGAAAFVYPSRYEGFGFPPLEAQATGTPVVTTRAGSLPEVVGDGAIIVDPTAGPDLVDALVAAISPLLDDPTPAAALVERGARNVARFTWPACVDGLVELYRAASAAR
ncbi:MAG TPA: glycosyltransferase family 1 protein [Acidimicrobiales bacterium]|jgi:glycosyltransferase involved in cell wall biosynthesis|nr:glycosyltransferase family 1 protein [Acidimicrobiales bacterium]